jgi:hypothetical protein
MEPQGAFRQVRPGYLFSTAEVYRDSTAQYILTIGNLDFLSLVQDRKSQVVDGLPLWVSGHCFDTISYITDIENKTTGLTSQANKWESILDRVGADMPVLDEAKTRTSLSLSELKSRSKNLESRHGNGHDQRLNTAPSTYSQILGQLYP